MDGKEESALWAQTPGISAFRPLWGGLGRVGACCSWQLGAKALSGKYLYTHWHFCGVDLKRAEILRKADVVLLQLEALGFCGLGEVGDIVGMTLEIGFDDVTPEVTLHRFGPGLSRSGGS